MFYAYLQNIRSKYHLLNQHIEKYTEALLTAILEKEIS